MIGFLLRLMFAAPATAGDSGLQYLEVIREGGIVVHADGPEGPLDLADGFLDTAGGVFFEDSPVLQANRNDLAFFVTAYNISQVDSGGVIADGCVQAEVAIHEPVAAVTVSAFSRVRVVFTTAERLAFDLEGLLSNDGGVAGEVSMSLARGGVSIAQASDAGVVAVRGLLFPGAIYTLAFSAETNLNLAGPKVVGELTDARAYRTPAPAGGELRPPAARGLLLTRAGLTEEVGSSTARALPGVPAGWRRGSVVSVGCFQGSFAVSEATHAAGDLNCDGFVSVGDIAPFVLALTAPDVYLAQLPECNIGLADTNENNVISVADIGGFVERLAE